MKRPRKKRKPQTGRRVATGRQLASMYQLLDLLYDKDAKDYRAGITDVVIAQACGIHPNTVGHARLKNYGQSKAGLKKAERPRSDNALLRLANDKLDRMIDLLETAVAYVKAQGG
jgi:hypothetical protein